MQKYKVMGMSVGNYLRNFCVYVISMGTGMFSAVALGSVRAAFRSVSFLLAI